MEAQGGAGNPAEANKDIQDLLKPSNSGDLATEPSHNPSGEEESGIVVSNSGLLQITERRQPLSSVSSLEVHFDLLDLTDFTDISDQELVEVFADSDDENRNESPARYRIRKGEGFADMEYAMMVSMGAVTHSTVVVTIVHDCQVVDIPEDLIESHDLTVDYVLPPTRVIQTECRHPKPQGIIWAKQGAQHRAFLDYSGREAAEAALAALQGLSIDGTGLQAELAKSQRSSRKPGQTWSRATTGLAEAQNPSLT